MLYLRQRTPVDLLDDLKGRTVQLPIGQKTVTVTIGNVVQVSLATKDRNVAKELHAAADAKLRAFWSLSRQLMSARALRRSPEAIAAIKDVTKPKPYTSKSMAEALRQYGDAAREALRQQGRPITEGSIAGIVGSIIEAYDKLQLTGNLIPYFENQEIKFRPVVPDAKVTEDRASISIVWNKWKRDRKDQVANSTISRYSPSVKSFIDFVNDIDIRDVTEDNVYEWAKYRLNQGVHARTINSNDLIALKSLFNWAISREGGRLTSVNPVQKVKLSEPRKEIKRERSFRDSEIATILRAASSIDAGPKSTSARRAQRWCPWLAAYSGARIGELTRLEVEDIRVEQECHIMEFRKTKIGIARSVPIHSHLIELGFLEFVAAIGNGPLFVDPIQAGSDTKNKKTSKTDPADIRSRKLAEWVRRAIQLDDGVAPNHAWRHTFKSRAVDVMDERISDFITGHTAVAVARKYEHASLKKMAEAIEAFPRYKI